MTDAPERQQAVTQLLGQLAEDPEGTAAARLVPLVADELHAMAERIFRHQPGRHTLQPTALVNEAYLRLVGQDETWAGRDHFFAVAATAMQQVLVDHARKRRAAKRGGGWDRVTLSGLPGSAAEMEVDVLDLQEALDALEALKPRLARIVQLRFFAGLTEATVAEVLGVSRKTVAQDWSFARAWLSRRLRGETEGEA